MDLNRCFIAGRLTRDVQLKYTAGGAAIADVSIATNRKWKDRDGGTREEVTFIDVTLWGKTAELAGQYLTKGSTVLIEGRLTLDSWDDKQTGQKRSKLKVTGEALHFTGNRQSDDGAAPGPADRQQPATSAPPPATAAPEPYVPPGSTVPPDDEVPF